MMPALFRRLLCRAGRHDVLRCAGAEDHAWTHDGARWTATLTRRPVLTAVAADQRVRAVPPRAGKNDHGRGWRAPRSGGYQPARSVPEPPAPPRGPGGASTPRHRA